MAECGKGWANRCAVARGRKCTCKCGGENHGKALDPALREQPKPKKTKAEKRRFTSDEEMHYGYDETRPARAFLPESESIRAIRFTRLAYDGLFEDVHDGGGSAVIEVVYDDHSEKLEQKYIRHSPTGMEFGYGGSGPADCALNVLALFLPLKEVTSRETHYQSFKFSFIGNVPQSEGGEISADAIRHWVRVQWAEANAPVAQ